MPSSGPLSRFWNRRSGRDSAIFRCKGLLRSGGGPPAAHPLAPFILVLGSHCHRLNRGRRVRKTAIKAERPRRAELHAEDHRHQFFADKLVTYEHWLRTQ